MFRLLTAGLAFQRFEPTRDLGFYNVKDFGARGDATGNDATAINAAITLASSEGGGIVYFPRGVYRTTATVIVPPTTSNTIILRGAGMRDCYIRPASNGMIAVLFGTDTPDASGTSTNNIMYCGMEDLSVTGVELTGGTNIGVQMTQMQSGWMERVIIEEFDNAANIGLYLRGSTTTGLGNPAAPHVWRCYFLHVISTTAIRPLVVENGDELTFIGCNFGVVPGLSAGTNIAVELIQFHNLRFISLLLSGDTNGANRPFYRGLRMNAPVNGDCIGLLIDGVVAEGFDVGLVFGGGNGQDAWVYQYASSSNRAAFNNGSDDAATSAERQNNVHIYMDGSAGSSGIPDYHAGRLPTPESVTLIMNGGGAFTPSVRGSNSFATSTNTAGSTLTDFLNGAPGQIIAVRLDANITIVHNAAIIRCPGAVNLAGAANKMAVFQRLGAIWQCLSVSQN